MVTVKHTSTDETLGTDSTTTMGILCKLSQQKRLFRQMLWLITILLLTLPTLSFSIELEMDEEVETLDVIEIIGTVVEQEPRDLNFALPNIQTKPLRLSDEKLALPRQELLKSLSPPSMVLLDHTANTRNILTTVKPLKTERPPYPRRAREQGWHGRVIVRLEISPDGTVESSAIHKSSGYEVLDNGAIKAATHWTFEPAKNGAFPVSATVNIPIQFDLEK